MENKHFSHPHGLTFFQNKPISETICSGCKFHCFDKTYVCWECNFFLHEQCFLATRSIDHPSHPAHPLNLVPYPTYPSGSFICNSCNQPGFGFSFGCSKCDYDLHLHCSNFNVESSTSSSPSPSQIQSKQINHKSHPEHVLQLLCAPSYKQGFFYCDACGEVGEATEFSCNICQYDVHEKCGTLPETMKREDHEHPLTLHYSLKHLSLPDGSQLTCDVCFRIVHEKLWNYYCKECDFGTHVNCVMAKARSKMEAVAEQNLEAKLELMNIQSMIQMNEAQKDMYETWMYGAYQNGPYGYGRYKYYTKIRY